MLDPQSVFCCGAQHTQSLTALISLTNSEHTSMDFCKCLYVRVATHADWPSILSLVLDLRLALLV